MKVTVDTNVLVRAVVQDDPVQSRRAAAVLRDASLIAVALPALCELVWVLRKVYGFHVSDVAQALRALMATANVAMNRPAAAGLAILEAGGDFADGVIAYEGNRLEGETFVSFDKKAVRLLVTQGQSARLL